MVLLLPILLLHFEESLMLRHFTTRLSLERCSLWFVLHYTRRFFHMLLFTTRWFPVPLKAGPMHGLCLTYFILHEAKLLSLCFTRRTYILYFSRGGSLCDPHWNISLPSRCCLFSFSRLWFLSPLPSWLISLKLTLAFICCLEWVNSRCIAVINIAI